MLRIISSCRSHSFVIHQIYRKISSKLSISENVKDALLLGKPVVALESTIISHGMPYPKNIEVAQQIEDVVRENGAIPATIAIIDGVPKIGLSYDEIQYLADPANHVIKASRRDLAYALSHNLTAATTVASTMILAHQAGIKVFATGGIGGVHRGAESTMDISADLIELGRTPVAVVCGGVKSILDIEKTLEVLETQGVPVIGYNCEEFPAFFTNASKIKSPLVVTDCESIAKMIYDAEMLKLSHGMVIAAQNPYPADSLLIQQAIDEALNDAKKQGIVGQAVTPHILAAVERITGGKSLESNIALVLNNAKIASLIAIELVNMYQLNTQFPSSVHSSKPSSSSAISSSVTASSTSSSIISTTSSISSRSKIICVGGAVVDMIGKVSSKLILKSSNPGTMTMTYGGVVFNICQYLAQSFPSPSDELTNQLTDSSSMKHDMELISLVGNDNYGQALLNHTSSLGINTTIMQQLSSDIIDKFANTIPVNALSQSSSSSNQLTNSPSINTATYTAIHGPDGDLCVAVADMSIFQHLTHHHINDLASKIRRSDLIVVDANISMAAFVGLMNVAQSYYVPVFYEPTSDHKCVLPILGNVIDKIDMMKPNVSELIVMIEACLEKNMITRNKAIINNVLTRFKTTSSSNKLDIGSIRILASGLLHLMMSQQSHSNRTDHQKKLVEPQLTSEGRIRRIRGKHIMISMGADGILWCGSRAMMIKDQDIANNIFIIDDDIACVHIPAVKIDDNEMMIHTSGAGDVLCGALIDSLFVDVRSVGPTARGIQDGLKAAHRHITRSR